MPTKILIIVLGLIFLPPMIQAQDPKDDQDSADTSGAQAVIKKLRNSTETTNQTKIITKSANTSVNRPSMPSCSLNWSSWWDNLAPERQTVLRQPGAVDRMIQMGGGLEAIPADEKRRSEEDDALAFQQDLAQGRVPPGMTSQEYTAFRRGVIDIYHCRKGDGEALTTRPTGTINCQDAAYYRDHQLVKEFDAAMTRYNVFRDGQMEQEKIKSENLKLMDTEWWGGKTTVQVAIEIKFYAHLFNDTVGWVSPEEYFERLYGKTAVEGLKLVQHDAIAVDAMKTETEEGAKQAAKNTFIECAKEVMGQVGSFVGMYDDLEEHNNDRAKLAQAQATLQKIASNIQQTINQYDRRIRESQASMRAITDVVAAIDQACAPTPVAISPR
jgi:hypothetical protein